MKTLIIALSVLTFGTTAGTLNTGLNTTLQKNNIITNNIAAKTQQVTKYIDQSGEEVTTNEKDLSNVISKEVTQIGFYQNEDKQIQVVRMPKTIKKVPNQLPPAITSLNFMFVGAASFNQNLWQWDTSNVTNMMGMFAGAVSFNQDLSTWDVSKVTSMSGMFAGCFWFNQDLSNWDVVSVEDMVGTFVNDLSFNQDLSRWNVSNVRIMTGMFAGAKLFNQDLSTWDVSKVIEHTHFAIGSAIYNSNNLPNFKK